MTFEEYRKAVVDEVAKRLAHCDWFEGVCCDDVRDDYNAGKSIKEAADAAELQTAYWDRPGGLFGDCGDGLGLSDAEEE